MPEITITITGHDNIDTDALLRITEDIGVHWRGMSPLRIEQDLEVDKRIETLFRNSLPQQAQTLYSSGYCNLSSRIFPVYYTAFQDRPYLSTSWKVYTNREILLGSMCVDISWHPEVNFIPQRERVLQILLMLIADERRVLQKANMFIAPEDDRLFPYRNPKKVWTRLSTRYPLHRLKYEFGHNLNSRHVV